MLIEFSVANYLSFKGKKTLNLETASITDFPENVLQVGRFKLLKSAAVYGANSSGKSNLIKAVGAMRQIVLESASRSSADELPIVPFLLNTATEKAPSFFEIVFAIGEMRYRYGFEATPSRVLSEWLFEAQKQAEKPLFLRVPEGIEVKPRFKEGRNLEPRTRENALFLSVVDQFNGPISKAIIQWLERLVVVSGLQHQHHGGQTIAFLKNEDGPAMQKFFGLLDLGFPELRLKKEDADLENRFADLRGSDFFRKLNDNFRDGKRTQAYSVHQKFDENGQAVADVEFNLEERESSGTNKIFGLAGPIFMALKQGSPLVVDELDAKLHPLLTLSILRLFNSIEHNPRNAQLVFATHDINLLNSGRLRRDQIFFAQKDEIEATDLYSLVEYRENGAVRKDRSFAKDYLQGRYGAIPFVGELSKLSEAWLEK